MKSRLAVLVVALLALTGVAGYQLSVNGAQFRASFQWLFGIGRASAVNYDPPPDNPSRSSASSEYSPHPFDWPQWQGPERSAVSKETGLLQDWPKEGPRLAWQADYFGVGYSTPSVAAGRVFLMGNRGKDEYVMALSEEDGGEIWAAKVGTVRATGSGFPGPRCSPTVDDNRVYALGLAGDLVCLNAATGKEIWRQDLASGAIGGRPGYWGYCESPLIDGDKLLCTPGGKTATLLALNKQSGKVIWKGPVPEGDEAHYASMIAIDIGDKREYVQFLKSGVVGFAVDGKYLWRYSNPANGTANCSTPLYFDGCVFAASNYGTGGGLARLDPATGADPKQVYFTTHMKNHHGGMVLVDGYIYGADDSLLTCLDGKTGQVKWSERKSGKGSIAAADGRLYFRNETGPMLLVEANPSKYIEHGRFDPPKKTNLNAWPHPVIANGKLYLRDQHLLFCYDVKQSVN